MLICLFLRHIMLILGRLSHMALTKSILAMQEVASA